MDWNAHVPIELSINLEILKALEAQLLFPLIKEK